MGLWMSPAPRGVRSAAALIAVLNGTGCHQAEAALKVVSPAAQCAPLWDIVGSVREIGLPTSGGRIQTAALTTGTSAKSEYCKVVTQIAPVNPSVQLVTVELNLP